MSAKKGISHKKRTVLKFNTNSKMADARSVGEASHLKEEDRPDLDHMKIKNHTKKAANIDYLFLILQVPFSKR